MPKNKNHLVLLGDSIIDNGVYVGPKELSVSEQVEIAVRKAGVKVTSLARDGDVISDVYSEDRPALRGLQFHKIPDNASHLVLSAGGNDVLGIIDILDREVKTVSDALEHLQWEVSAFGSRYAECLDRLLDLKLPIWALTIYDPCFRNEDHVGPYETGIEKTKAEAAPKGIDVVRNAIAHTALALFNDEIRLQALRRNVSVIDIRTIFTDPEDYANPIEPSAKGGAKLAQEIAKAIRGDV